MKLPHYSRLGSPTSPHGAICIANDQEGIILMYADICKTALQANGIEITPDIEYQIISYCRKRQAKYNRQVASEGIREVQNIMLIQSSLSWHCNNANN